MTVLRHFYVHDCLKTIYTSDEDAVINLTGELMDLLEKRGFQTDQVDEQ